MTQQEVIKAFMQSLDKTELTGRAALDEAVKTASKSKFKNFEELAESFLSDHYAAKNWHTFLVEKCGIILDNDDTGAISGADAGGTHKTATDIIPSEGDASMPSGTSFTVDGLTIYGIPPEETLTDDQKYIVKGLYSWWIRDSLALLKESYGFSFEDADTTNSRMKLKFVDNSSQSFLAYVAPDTSDGKTVEARTLCVNMHYFKDMDPDNRHGSTGSMALDRTLVHELTHAVMAANIDYFADYPMWLIEGGSAELIHGIDDERRIDIINYAQDPSVFEKILTALGEPGYSERPYEIYAGGYMFMRYFAKQAATDTTFDYDTYSATVKVDSKNFAVNYFDTVTMSGSSKADTIINSGSQVSITGGKGNDLIKSFSKNVSISGGAGKDSIYNDSSQATIRGGAGNDSIINGGMNLLNMFLSVAGVGGSGTTTNSNVAIYGDAGNDYILSVGTKVTIDGGAGNDSIISYGSKATIYSGAGNDYINNVSSKVSVFGGAGDDTIANTGSRVSIDGGAGKDSILNGSETDSLFTNGSLSAVYGGDDNDIIINYAKKTTLSGDAGDDVITNNASLVSVYGGDGADSISNSNSKVKIYGEAGADSVSNEGENVSIFGGADNDYVSNEVDGEKAYISLGDGDDTAYNYADSTKIYGGNGADAIINLGDYLTLSGGAGNDSITNFGDKGNILGGKGNDILYSSGTRISINGDAGNDSIHSEGSVVLINGGAGNDTIQSKGDHVIINGGKGNNLIKVSGKDVQIDISAGNDTVKISSSSVSVVGFDKGDVISFDKDVTALDTIDGGIIATTADGNFTINGVTSYTAEGNWSLKGQVASYSQTVGVGAGISDGNIVWQAGATEYVVIDGVKSVEDMEPKYDIVNIYPDNLADSATIKTNEAGFSFTASGVFDNQKLTGSSLSDTIYGETSYFTIDGGDGGDSLSAGGDFMAISGGKGKDTLENIGGQSVTMNGGAGNDSLLNSGQNCSVYGDAGNDTLENQADNVLISGGAGNDKLINLLAKNVKISGGAGKDSIINGDDTFTVSYSTIAGGADADYINNYGDNVSISGGAGNDDIYNRGRTSTVDAGSGADNIYNTGDSSTVFGGTGHDTVYVYGANDSIDGGAGNDLINLYSDGVTVNVSSGNDTIYVNSNIEGLAVSGFGKGDVLNFDFPVTEISTIDGGIIATTTNGNFTINGVTPYTSEGNWSLEGQVASYAKTLGAGARISDGNIIWQEDKVDTKSVVIDGIKSVEDMEPVYNTVNIYSDNLAGNATIKNNDAGFGFNLGGVFSKETFTGTSGSDSIHFDSAYLTVEGGAGDDSLIGCTDYGIIRGGDGNDTIHNTTGGSVKISGGAGNDSILNNGTNSSIYGGAGADTLENHSNNVLLNGGSGNDSLTNLWATNVTMAGGKGNDTLWGDEYSETFVYKSGDGKDIIYGFDDNDTLSLDGLEFTSSYSKKNAAVTLKFSSGSVKLQDFTAKTFHVNDDTYQIKSGKFVKK